MTLKIDVYFDIRGSMVIKLVIWYLLRDMLYTLITSHFTIQTRKKKVYKNSAKPHDGIYEKGDNPEITRVTPVDWGQNQVLGGGIASRGQSQVRDQNSTFPAQTLRMLNIDNISRLFWQRMGMSKQIFEKDLHYRKRINIYQK